MTDNQTYAYPLLKHHNVPFTVYVPTDFPDGQGEHPGNIHRGGLVCAEVFSPLRPSVHDGEAIGGIGLTPFKDVGCKTAEFGYWLGEAHWGRGIASAAAKAFIAHVFENDAFVRLQAGVFEWNPASMRVLEKVGCVREGVLRCSVFKDGQVIDRVLYAITRDSMRGPA